MDYNKTIHLPKTEFPMRAGLPNREPGMLQRWYDMDLYREMLKKNEGRPRFSLHDGPPFSNGDMHMGHALNRSIKDFIVRSYAMRGYYTPFIPGWDNHGMPIESAIIKKNKLNHKAMAVPEFRSACHDFAQNFVDRQRESAKRLGVLGDWENPYLTMKPTFEAEEVKVFGEMFKKGHIYKGLKPVYWCPKDETALAEAEIEYADEPCTSIFVKFQLKDDQGKLAQYGDVHHMYVIIWTTTTWTLPGNQAVTLHPREEYALVKAENGEMYLTARALCEKTMKVGGVERYETVATFPGAFFEYMTCQHPFLDRDSLLTLAEYVTMDSGTGCVHTAPGFGADDYQTCLRYHIDMVVPVDDRGFQTEDAGMFSGMHYDKSNGAIQAYLKETNHLFASEEIIHSYPHCWRCKSPIIFRATPQWFCSVDAFKEEAVAACDDVEWFPAWGKERMVAMIRERADWCISRQRRWGLPIPVFYCDSCGRPVCDATTISAISRLFEEKGSNAWYEMAAADILPAEYQCPHCGGAAFTKEEDTLDGWFDSGSSHMASMQRDQGFWPSDMYLEGADQYRGWFQSSLLTAVASRGKAEAPFKQCLTHGWTVDGEGRAMHKSLGNGVDPADLVKKYGGDLVRLWAGSSDYQVDVRCSDGIFQQLSQSYLKFRNTARYCLGNLDGFDPDHLVAPGEMQELDRWAVTRLNALMEKCRKAYEIYEFHVVSHAINDFCVVDLSSFYLDIIKDRLYCDEKDGLPRRSAQTALWLILDTMTKLFAPILAFTCDEIWQAMPHRAEDDGRNVVLNEMNQPFAEYGLDDMTVTRWDALQSLRSDVNVVLESARAEKRIGKALEAQITLRPQDGNAEALLTQFAGMDLSDLFIVSEVKKEKGDTGVAGSNFPNIFVEVAPAEGGKCERCWKHDPLIGQHKAHATLCPRCAAVVEQRSFDEV